MSDTERLHIRVRGTVQGVGFRYFTHRRAEELGLVGYVRNTPDGGVEIEAEGPSGAVSRLARLVKQGPPGARVREAVVQARPVRGAELGFEVRFF